MKLIDSACPITVDIDPEAHVSAELTDRLVAGCVAAVTETLKRPIPSCTEFHRAHLMTLFHAMKWTHASIRDLLRHETSRPTSIDAMPLVRTQLESLYAICLLVEDPRYLEIFLKASWKKLFVRFLLQREECRSLARFSDFLNNKALPTLDAMARFINVTPAEKMTIELDALGIPFPLGFVPEYIPEFPTPKRVINRIKEVDRKRMLERLYPEYQFLCSFVHTSPQPGMFKVMLDKRLPFFELFTTGNIEHMFQGEIAGPALYMDVLSVAQSCAEILTLYRSDLELLRVVESAWRMLTEKSLLGRVVWEIRTRKLLGVVA